jgi:hypothetical protein
MGKFRKYMCTLHVCIFHLLNYRYILETFYAYDLLRALTVQTMTEAVSFRQVSVMSICGNFTVVYNGLAIDSTEGVLQTGVSHVNLWKLHCSVQHVQWFSNRQ